MTPEETFTRDFHKRLFHNSRSRDPRRRIIRHAPLPPARPPSASIGKLERRKQERRKERGERREERGERRKKKEERQKKNKKTHKKTAKNTQNHKKYAGGVQTRMDVIALLTPVCIDPITTRFASVPAAPSGSGESR